MKSMLVKTTKQGKFFEYDVFANTVDQAKKYLPVGAGDVVWICENPVHLQYFGKAPAVLGQVLLVGDTLLFNTGVKGLIRKVLKTTPAFITFQVEEDGKLYERRIGKNRYAPCTDATFERWLTTQ